MILSICLDPVMEKIYYLDNLHPKVENFANKKVYNIGGKCTVSGRILKNLNADIFASGFLGGLQGQYIFSKFKEADIYNDFVPIKDDTKSSVIIFQNDELLTKIIEASPRITREERNSFYDVYEKILDKFDIVLGQGGLPAGLSDDIYYDLITMANRSNKKFILEAKEEELKYGLLANPFMVKLKKDDLEYLSNLHLDFESEIIKVGHSIVEQGIELVVIDLDEKGSIVLTKNKGYRLEFNNEINNIGEDNGYMVAGFAFGLYKKHDLETIMKLGQGARLAYSTVDDIDRIDMSDIKRYMSIIEIGTINY
ncbi:MAG: hypothetical protein GX053_05385 [Tissierella sp.]|nr:hypothetical protein [Tissierella sp.]